MAEGRQVLKSREDHTPIYLLPARDEGFVLEQGVKCSWVSNEEEILTTDRLRKRIEPWLTALCQSEHLSLLVGSGLTQAVHIMATNKGLPGMGTVYFGESDLAETLTREVQRSAEATLRGTGNIEDQVRAANELLRGLEILKGGATQRDWVESWAADLQKHLTRALKDFAVSLLEGEAGILQASGNRRVRAFNYLVTFLMSFASRSGTRDRLHIFTTNYDRIIEAGSDVAGLHLLDRFVGGLTPVFRSSRLNLDIHYNPPGIRGEPRYLEGVARFTKLHGSVDWVDTLGTIRKVGVPFGALDVTPYLGAPGLQGVDALRLMIYPNAAKDRETAGYPYVDLFRDFAAACCRPNHTLFTYGYGFGDEHVNRTIADMLTIPSTHLVIISYDDPLNRIMQFYERIGRPAQISLLIGNHFGDLTQLVDWYLPKPAIDRTTIRMGDLLAARWRTNSPSPHKLGEDVRSDDGGEA